jgi:hypothetical protein
MAKARVFTSGSTQFVRLPKGFEMDFGAIEIFRPDCPKGKEAGPSSCEADETAEIRPLSRGKISLGT